MTLLANLVGQRILGVMSGVEWCSPPLVGYSHWRRRIKATFTERGAAVPMHSEWHIDLQPENGNGRALSWSGPRVTVSAPGTYTLKVVDAHGDTVVEPRPVTVAPIGWTPVQIELAP
ncbi:MAG: hypothetical protein AAF628_32185 [Planctomycetota bacterium]